MMKIRWVWLPALATALLGARAKAEDASCQTAYERAQEFRTESRLGAARRELERCVQADCPDFVRGDCDRWLDEVEAAQPSLVLGATLEGRDLTDVDVFVDGTQLVEQLDGKAVAVDPGRHSLRFAAKGAEPLTLEVVVREGEKSRVVVAPLHAVKSSSPVASEQPAEAPRANRNPLSYVLAGVGVVGIGGFIALGSMGNSQRSDLEETCSPHCTDEELRPVRTKYLLADVSLGIGIVALGAAGYLFFSGPAHAPASAPRPLAFDVVVTPRSSTAELSGRF